MRLPTLSLPLLFSGCLLALILSACKDSEQEKREQAALFTTTSKPKPNPKKESLESLVRTEKTKKETNKGLYNFPLFSEYAGEDIRQVTEVSGRSLLLCFSAPWCPYSKKMITSLQELADKEKGRVQVVAINADDYPHLAEKYKIKKIPSTFLFVEGVQLRKIEGAFTAESLQKYLQKTLSTHKNTNN